MMQNDFGKKVVRWATADGRFFACFACFTVMTVLFGMSQGLFASETAGEGGAGGLNPLTWKTDLAIWTAVIFVALVMVLGKFAFRPIANALDAREKSMIDRVAMAAKANTDARLLLEEYQQKLAGSEKEVREMLESAKQDAEKAASTILEKAREAASQEQKRALVEIESATEVALQELATKSADLATSLAGKILKEKIDPKQHAQLIDGAIHQFIDQ